MKRKPVAIFLFISLSFLFLTGCGGGPAKLGPKNPVTLTMWHVFGSQTESPMNDMVEAFNHTVGKEKGITINITSVSNSSDIHSALLSAAKGEAGAGSLPDLFFCYPETAGSIGAEKLIRWSDVFSEGELLEYVPSFLDEGRVNGDLLVLPVAKSSEALFINETIFERFAADTGAAYEDLHTWDGLFKAAQQYYEWSDGKTFVMHDELLNFVQINTAALGSSAFANGELDFENPVFKAQWEQVAKAAISGTLRVEDNYETVRMMTGDIVAGIGSTASIMYFQDVVTYSDNTKEPLVIKALPCPVTQSGEQMAMQQGVGLCAARGDEKKQAAALIFAKWITQGEANLDFVTQSGYMPVQNSSFEAIGDYNFANESYRSLYEAMDFMHAEYSFYLPPVVDGYYDILWTFYDGSIEVLCECKAAYEQGEGGLDELAERSFNMMKEIMQR
jgi:multiple sugar transport system substrate-binding protein